MTDPREKLFYWDGRQREITEFMSELFDDPDEHDQDWETVYKKNRIE